MKPEPLDVIDDQPKPQMRAKVRIGAIIPNPGGTTETLHFHGVAKNGGYGADGLDEDNTFATFTPSLNQQLHLANPALVGTFEVGDTFYLDFIPAPK